MTCQAMRVDWCSVVGYAGIFAFPVGGGALSVCLLQIHLICQKVGMVRLVDALDCTVVQAKTPNR